MQHSQILQSYHFLTSTIVGQSIWGRLGCYVVGRPTLKPESHQAILHAVTCIQCYRTRQSHRAYSLEPVFASVADTNATQW